MYKSSSKGSSRSSFVKAMAGNGPKKEYGVIKDIPKKVKTAAKSGQLIQGSLLKVVKGGLKVDLYGCEGFCPFSEFPKDITNDEFSELMRTKIPLKFKVVSCESSGSIILSRKNAIADACLLRAQKALQKGSYIDGKVNEVLPYGAFIDIGGVDGLLHISKLSLANLPVKGSYLKVKVVTIEDNGKRISLGVS